MNKNNWKIWVHAASVRAVKTMAQTAVGVIGASTVISAVDWRVVVSASLLAGLVITADFCGRFAGGQHGC